jgi:hypothetical protein
MRAAALAGLCALLAGTTAGCGSDVSQGSAAVRAARIRAILADMKDLPAGFSDRPRDAWRVPFRAKDPSCRELLNAAGGRLPRDGLTASAGATYQGDRLGETAGLRLTEFSGGQADQLYERLAGAIGECSSARSRGAGGQDRLRASPLAIESGGDAEATRMRGRVGGYPYEMHLVIARSGRTLISLVHTGMAAPEPRRTQELVRLMLAKIERTP